MSERIPHLFLAGLLALLVAPAACVHQRAGESQLPSVEAGPPEQGARGPLSEDERKASEDLEELHPDFYAFIDA